MPTSADDFRAALGRWPSGVTIVTTRDDDGVYGMTVSAFTSVSLDPPLVLVCADRGSETRPKIAASGVFAVNVLAREQEALSNRFAKKGNEAVRFEGVAWTPAASGAPLLEGALVTLDCRLRDTHEAGDHVIFVGEVEDGRVADGAPLIYCAGRYRALAEEA